jgi:PAS domain S-box-containing protein
MPKSDRSPSQKASKQRHKKIDEQKPVQEIVKQGGEPFRLLVESVKDYGIFMLDTTGHIVTWNLGAENIKGYTADEIIGKHFSTFYPQEDLDWDKPGYELKVAAEVGRFEDEGWRLRKDGTRFWANVIITALRDKDGTLCGFGKVTRDLTERKAAEEGLRHSEERFRLMIEGVKDYAIFMLDPRGNVESWNAGAERIKGYKAEEIIGKHFSTFYPEEDLRWDKPGYELKVAAEVGRFEDEGWRLRKDGTRFWANVIITAIRDKDGTLRGFGKVTRDLTERKAAEEQRLKLAREQVARAEAEAANRAKDEFVATVSHELRTPLNAMLGWGRMLRSGKLDEEGVRRALETIERNAKLQAQLIDDLLDMSRIISGKLRLTVGPVDLHPVIEAALEGMQPAADAKGIRLQAVLDSNVGLISGDPDRLQQVIWNLISNAVKFTPKGGRVQVRLQRINSHVEVTVSDTGQGISSDFLPYVFDRFRQADSAITRMHGGLGLGLAIVRHLVELHGGMVEATSPGEGQGATFTVKLPIMISHDSGRFLSNAQEADRARIWQQAGFECPPSLAGLRVLILDDEADARALLKVIIEQCRAEVTTAASAAEAYETLERLTPDVIISDIGMPSEDGYSFMRKVRAKEAVTQTRIPAVALTAHARAEDRLRALSAGYQVHVAKPIEPAELVAVIASLLGPKRSNN